MSLFYKQGSVGDSHDLQYLKPGDKKTIKFGNDKVTFYKQQNNNYKIIKNSGELFPPKEEYNHADIMINVRRFHEPKKYLYKPFNWDDWQGGKRRKTQKRGKTKKNKRKIKKKKTYRRKSKY